MEKNFYKSKRTVPTFYDENLITRCSAYGKDVLNDFLRWRNKFYSMWKNPDLNALFSAQGSIDGIDARLRGDEYVLALGNANVKQPSQLPPLIYANDIWESDDKGRVSYNGEKTSLNIGSELKAWALLTMLDASREMFLAVIGKPTGCSDLCLSVYTLPSDDSDAIRLDSVELAAALDSSSYIICFERNIFIVHASKLDYYYFNLQDNKLERCAIGADGDNSAFKWCRYVKPRVVCDQSANIYWATDSALYSFKLGCPRDLRVVDDFEGSDCCNLQCFGNALYVYYVRYGEYVCFKYSLDEDGTFVKRKFNVGAKANLFLTATDESSSYVKVMDGDDCDKVVMAVQSNGKEFIRGQTCTVSKNAFCYFGEMAGNSRYVGTFNQRKTISFTKN